MANEIITNLRRSINIKHDEALKALGVISDYLEESLPKDNGSGASKKRKSPRLGTGGIRNAVIEVLRDKHLSIATIAEQTKLKPMQIRGVVTAPALKKHIVKKEIDGVMHYKYET